MKVFPKLSFFLLSVVAVISLLAAFFTFGTSGWRAGAQGQDVVRKANLKQRAPESPSGAITVTSLTSQTPNSLVQRIVGNNVPFSNVSYIGANGASGTFAGGTGIIGFEDGILLTSGSVQNVVGPNDLDDAGFDNGVPGDANLNSITPGTEDASVLQFDFVPTTNLVTFEYVFASEEYNEFANGSFNDVFGFFLNGTNVALLPGTSIPVSINTVNGGRPFGTNAQNPQFFRNNDLQDGGGFIDTELDGLTTVLRVEATVTPNQTNRIKLAIADVGDGAYDSAVFIRTASFAAPSVSLNVAPTSIVENALGAMVYTFTRTSAAAGALTVNFSLGGTATGPGGTVPADYACLAGTGATGVTCNPTGGTITFGAGATAAQLLIDPATDLSVEPAETVVVTTVPGTGYIVGSPPAATGTIIDSPPLACTPISILPGQTFNGVINANSCSINGERTDLYTFSGSQGERIAATMTSANLFTRLELVDSGGTVLATGGGIPGLRNSRLPASDHFTLPASGTYTIRAIGLQSGTGTYTLSLFRAPQVACSYSLSPDRTVVSPAGGTFFFDVLAPPGCAPPEAPVAPQGAIYSIVSFANGRVTFNVQANPSGGAAREATISVGGRTHRISQFASTAPPNDLFANAQALPPVSPGANPLDEVAHAPGLIAPATSEGLISQFFRGVSDFITGAQNPDHPNSVETGTGRQVRGAQVSGPPDSFVFFPVEMVATGGETAQSLSLQFDPTRLSINGTSGVNNNPDITPGSALLASVPRTVNGTQVGQGRIGVLVDFQSELQAGVRQTIVFRFRILPGAPNGATPISFVDQPILRSITNAFAQELPAKYTNSAIVIGLATPTPTATPTATPTPTPSPPTPVPTPTPVAGTNVNATAEPGEPSHAGSTATRSVWYSFIPSVGGLYSFSTSGSSFDTLMAIYACPATGACSFTNFNLVGSNDDTTSFDVTSKINFRADAGTRYLIAIDGKNGATGTIQLSYFRYERLYRLYLLNYNGTPITIVPDSVTASNGTTTRAGVLISLGVYEFNLPADNSIYTVSISGPAGIVWNPNNFPLDTSFRLLDELMEGPGTGGQNTTANAQCADGCSVVGFVRNITQADVTQGRIRVEIGYTRDSTPARRDEENCLVSFQNDLGVGHARYQCISYPQTNHDIVPQMEGKRFVEAIFSFSNPVGPVLEDIRTPRFVASDAQTFLISGRVLAGGAGTRVDLTYTPPNAPTISRDTRTAADGSYEFRDLLPGTYQPRATREGTIFNTPAPVVLSTANATGVDISAQSACAYDVTNPAQFLPAGGPGTFTVTTASNCDWEASSEASWITVNSGVGRGTGTTQITVQPNLGPARTGAVRISNRPDRVVIVQASGCAFTLGTPTIVNLPASGGSGTINVSATSAECGYAPTATDFCMVSNLTASGQGNGAISFTISPNAGVARSTVITVGNQSVTINQAAGATNVRSRSDFDGDSRADLAVYRPSDGFWYVQTRAGFYGLPFGIAEDIPVAADYDGDGRTDIAVFRPSNLFWYRINSSNNDVVSTQFGVAGDTPVPADYDGDGRADIAHFRRSDGTWRILRSSDGVNFNLQHGAGTDRPVPADYDGDGRSDIAVYRPSSGTWFVVGSAGSAINIPFGAAGGADIPVPGDYDRDGRAELAVYRPSDGIWYRLNAQTGAFAATQWGAPGDLPVPADYNGDRSTDLAVYRPSTGIWYIWSCTSNPRFDAAQFGAAGDVVVPFTGSP